MIGEGWSSRKLCEFLYFEDPTFDLHSIPTFAIEEERTNEENEEDDSACYTASDDGACVGMRRGVQVGT